MRPCELRDGVGLWWNQGGRCGEPSRSQGRRGRFWCLASEVDQGMGTGDRELCEDRDPSVNGATAMRCEGRCEPCEVMRCRAAGARVPPTTPWGCRSRGSGEEGLDRAP